MSTETGEQRRCDECGAEVIVIRGGDGDVQCHGEPMARKES